MALSDDVRLLRDRVLVELTSFHDYYSDTKMAWWLVRRFIASGRSISKRNSVTVTTPSELATKAREYVAEQLREATFQQFVSIFENFYFDLLCLWLTAYPQSLGARMVDFKSVLELPNKDAITQLIVRRELNEILYARPTKWFIYLEEKVKLGCPSTTEIEQIAEAKASRDVLVHNRGVANDTYVSKAANLARVQVGEKIAIPGQYHRETWELIRKVVSDVSVAAIAKAP